MAVSASTVFEIRTAGSDTNGGGFVTGATGTDYSQQNNKNVATGTDDSTTDAVGNATTTLTSATANFQASIVGNIIYLQGGTGSLAAGWYQVISRTSATAIVLDRSVATGTGITMNIGGALASLGMACGAASVSGITYYVKSGTYTISSGTSNISGGVASPTGYVIGYNATRLDYGTPPVLQFGLSTSSVAITNLGPGCVLNVVIDGASFANTRGITVSGAGAVLVYKCECKNMGGQAFAGGGNGAMFVNCWSHNSTGIGFGTTSQSIYYGCVANNQTTMGFSTGSLSRLVDCIAYSNTQDGFECNSGVSEFVNCTAYGNGRDGFRMAQASCRFVNCIAEANVGVGFNSTVNSVNLFMLNCGVYNNGTNVTIGTGKNAQNLGLITATTTFFTNAAAGDFSLNNTGTGGALAKAAATPSIFPGALTTNYKDLGAAQAQSTGGSVATPTSFMFFG